MSNYIVDPFQNFGPTPPPPTRNAWVELARATLGVDGDELEVTIPNKRYLMVLVKYIATGEVRNSIAFNDVRGTNYSRRYNFDGSPEQALASTDSIIDGFTPISNTQGFSVMYVDNNPVEEKLVQGHEVVQDIAGAGTVPKRTEFTGKFSDILNPITKVEHINDGGTGDLGAGTELVVLGFDPADGLGAPSNFWQLLASTDTIITNEFLEASFTPKKYLWVQASYKADGNPSGVQWNTRMGKTTIDVANNYAYRASFNGGAEQLFANQSRIYAGTNLVTNERGYVNMFIENFDNQEKLLIGHLVGNNTDGPTAIPQRSEFVGKYVEPLGPNDQIDIIRVGDEFEVGNITDGSLRIWGHD